MFVILFLAFALDSELECLMPGIYADCRE